MAKLPVPAKDRFWKFLPADRSHDSCWEWNGARSRTGHGFMFDRNKDRKSTPILAHRLAWEIANGPIPEGLCILHKCDNPPCCNPEHLWLGTRADNMHDMGAKGRASKGEAKANAKLTEDIVRSIRASKLTAAELAKRYGVGRSTVTKVLLGLAWRHVV